ncbi:RNA-directed DNA polymerase, eukaryota, reverse transcriptase zinc-binding domain protein [Tanacetum coccineum]
MVKNNDVTEDGMVKVLFNGEIASKGCAKWKYTICGQFIGQNMSYFEMRYHARRMWGRYGLTEVIVNSSGVNLFKDEKGMNCVLEQGPWLIRSRRMLKEQEEQRENVEDVRKNVNEIGQTMREDNVMGLSKGILN